MPVKTMSFLLGLTFVENALIKARNASEQSDLPALADDSGLNVASLDGDPGIYSGSKNIKLVLVASLLSTQL